MLFLNKRQILVRIVKDWDFPDLMRQTPNFSGIWDGIEFTLESVYKCDYVVVLNHARKGEQVRVHCPPDNIWAIMQEPPNEELKPMHKGIREFSRIYTSDTNLRGNPYRHSQTALPWHINKDYDFLKGCTTPKKERNLSWITSNISVWQGHLLRMSFLKQILGKIDFDLFGLGFNHIDDKWDGLAPYRYSLAVENFQNSYYWTEKIADCFLSWTMPVYYGCEKITDYFPEESMILIDIKEPIEALSTIKEAIASNRWERNLAAIAHAREQVLNKYQLFPFIAGEIRRDKKCRLLNYFKTKTTVFSGYNRIPPVLNPTDEVRI